ncbi:MAG: TIM barrel protein [Bacteroidales bacterium]|nr:TIM barrel protein [Bacteroidales bacterium]
MKRRTFIRTTSAGMIAGMLMPKGILANSMPAKHNIGLQLYSLRNEIKDDLPGSLEKISNIGYKNLEAAGYQDGKFYGMNPAAFKSLVEDYGMKLTSSHVTFEKDEISTVLQAHREAGVKYMVWPWLSNEQRKSLDSYKIVIEKFNTIGELCNQNGLLFGYHNHAFEFTPIEGVIPYDLMLESTDPGFVFMQIDLYWAVYAGIDPIAYFEKYPGRFKLWHVKDMLAGELKEMTEVGTGVIDYKKIFESASLSGMKEFFVEQDVIRGDGFESVKKSFDYMNDTF